MFERGHKRQNCDFWVNQSKSHNIYFVSLAAKLVSKLNRHNILIWLVSISTLISEILFLPAIAATMIFAAVVWG